MEILRFLGGGVVSRNSSQSCFFFGFLANQGKCGHEQKRLHEWGHNCRKHRLCRDDQSNKTKMKIYTKNEDSYTGVFEPYLRETYWQLMESNNGLEVPN